MGNIQDQALSVGFTLLLQRSLPLNLLCHMIEGVLQLTEFLYRPYRHSGRIIAVFDLLHSLTQLL
ncbi:hypothetical protein D3C73_1422210 [compost metagenome]